MRKKGNIRKYTATELDRMLARGEDKSDWATLDAMSEEELERAIADDPDHNMPVDMSTLILNTPPTKEGVYIRLDPDILVYFRKDGPGYQTRINAVLRAWVDAMKAREVRKPAAE